MLRGNEQRQVFQDAEDNERFLEMLSACKALSGFEVYAYCLMGNHLHLLIRTEENGETLGQIFRRLGAQYVYWYNGKYGRVGHLFQDRYRSEPIEDDAYLLSVLRYIHQNPVKAGMVQDMADYPYSSYREYLKQKSGELADVTFIQGIMDHEAFAAFHKKADDLEYMDVQPVRPKMCDEQAKRLIAAATGCNTVEAFQSLDKTRRMEVLVELKKRNASYRQISRLTGESIGIIRKA
jgi:REP element-mobilizing transposase RayT